MATETPRGPSGLLIGAVVVAGLLVGVLPVFTAAKASSVATTVGTFHDPVLAPQWVESEECLTYGTHRALTVYTDDPQSQDETLGSYNEVRWGRSLSSDGQGACLPTPEAEGLAFSGARSAAAVDGLIELGQITHDDHPSADALRAVTLSVVAGLDNPMTGDPELVETIFDVAWREGAEQVQLSSVDPEPSAQNCALQVGRPNPLDGSAIPASAALLNGPVSTLDADDGRAYVPCADTVSVATADSSVPAQRGETSTTLRVAGWSSVALNGECDRATFHAGSVAYFRGGAETTMCLFGEVAPAELTVEGTLSDGGSGSVSFALTPVDQADGDTSLEAESLVRSIDVVDGAGETALGSIEPGLYALTQTAAPSGYALDEVSCTRPDGSSALIERHQRTLLDLDSSAEVTCRLGSVQETELLVTAVADDGPHAPMSLTVDGPSLREPRRLALADDGMPAASDVLTLPAGDYAVTFDLPNGWRAGSPEFDGQEGSTLRGGGDPGTTVNLTLAPGTRNELRVPAAAQAADLVVTADTDAGEFGVGDDIVWAISATNRGPALARNVVLTQEIPAGASSIHMPANSDCDLVGQQMQCQLGIVVPDQTRTITFDMTMNESGGATTTTVVTQDGADLHQADNSVRASVMVLDSEGALHEAEERMIMGLVGGALGCFTVAGILLVLAYRRPVRPRAVFIA